MRIPSLRALSTMFSVMPEPGVAIRPWGIVSSILSLRLKGAALPWLFYANATYMIVDACWLLFVPSCEFSRCCDVELPSCVAVPSLCFLCC